MVGPDNGVLNETLEIIDLLGLNSSVKIVGSVPNSELFNYYQTHGIYLNTTSYESFGVALIEAASCGIPIVSTNVGEIPYIWKDNYDILLSSFDSILFASRVKDILKDKELSEKLSFNARSLVQRFNWGNVNGQWEKLLLS
jgi:glycosyltransferase involved in cell wall biosynthesis